MSSSSDQLCRPGVVKVRGSGPHKFPHLFPLKVSSREKWSCTRVQSGSSMDLWPVWKPSHSVSQLLRHSTFCYPKWHVCFCLHWKLIRANQHFDPRDHQMPGPGVFLQTSNLHLDRIDIPGRGEAGDKMLWSWTLHLHFRLTKQVLGKSVLWPIITYKLKLPNFPDRSESCPNAAWSSICMNCWSVPFCLCHIPKPRFTF